MVNVWYATKQELPPTLPTRKIMCNQRGSSNLDTCAARNLLDRDHIPMTQVNCRSTLGMTDYYLKWSVKSYTSPCKYGTRSRKFYKTKKIVIDLADTNVLLN